MGLLSSILLCRQRNRILENVTCPGLGPGKVIGWGSTQARLTPAKVSCIEHSTPLGRSRYAGIPSVVYLDLKPRHHPQVFSWFSGIDFYPSLESLLSNPLISFFAFYPINVGLAWLKYWVLNQCLDMGLAAHPWASTSSSLYSNAWPRIIYHEDPNISENDPSH